MRYAALGLILLPCVATAQPTALRLDDRLALEGHVDNGNRLTDDDDYGAALERLIVTGNAGALTASVEIDAELFQGRPSAAYQDDARLERISVGYDLDDWQVTLGDLHRQLGRGIVLSLRKIDELGEDTTLQGGQLSLSLDDHEADLFAGRTNASQLDAVSQKHTEDPGDVIAGGAYSFHGLSWLTVGVHGLHLRPRVDVLPEEGQDHASALGAFLETPPLGDVLAIYLEADWEGRHVAGQGEQAKAMYGSADLTLGAVDVLLEGLLLDHFFVRGSPNTLLRKPFDYAQPPTLERFDQEVIDNTNTRGGRAKVSYALLEGDLVPYVNAMYRQNDPGDEAQLDQLHAYVGVDLAYQDGRSRVGLSGGWRRERQQDEIVKGMIHGDVDWLQALPAAWALHLTVSHESRELAGRDYLRGTTLVGLEKGGLGAATAEIGYDTQDDSGDVRQVFVAGILSWETSPDLALRATGGNQRGGLKCVAGVCRDFPAFSGGRLEIVARHDLL